jgi:hypothetical protein
MSRNLVTVSLYIHFDDKHVEDKDSSSSLRDEHHDNQSNSCTLDFVVVFGLAVPDLTAWSHHDTTNRWEDPIWI